MAIRSSRGRRLHRQWLVVLCVALVLLGMHCSHFLHPRERIIVVGAGLAGLAAARALIEAQAAALAANTAALQALRDAAEGFRFVGVATWGVRRDDQVVIMEREVGE